MHVDPAHPQIGIWGKKWNPLNSKCRDPFYFLSQPSLNIAVSTYYLSPPSPSHCFAVPGPPVGECAAGRGLRLSEAASGWTSTMSGGGIDGAPVGVRPDGP